MSIVELGMVFQGANQFKKVVSNYILVYIRQIKLRPNEKYSVRVKCRNSNCKWLLYAFIDRDSDNFIVKNFPLVHKCIPIKKTRCVIQSWLLEV